MVFSAKKEREKKTAIFKKFQMKTKLGVLQVEIKIVHFRMPMVKKKLAIFRAPKARAKKNRIFCHAGALEIVWSIFTEEAYTSTIFSLILVMYIIYEAPNACIV